MGKKDVARSDEALSVAERSVRQCCSVSLRLGAGVRVCEMDRISPVRLS